MTGRPDLVAGLWWEVGFTHQGLATATLWLTILTTVTGLGLLWLRYGASGGGNLPTALRWFHIVAGLAMAVYLFATYWIVPV